MTKLAERAPNAAMHDRLIEAAGEIFGEKGFRSATVREITTRAGANVAAINYYFRDKQELYAATLRHAVQASLQCNAATIDESLTPEEQLHQFIITKLTHWLDPRRPKWHGQLMAHEMSAPTESLDLVVSELISPRLSAFRRIVSGIAGPLPEKKLTLLLLSVMSQCAYYRQSAPMIDRLFPKLMRGPQIIPEIAEHITAFSIAGIRACRPTRSK